jgi:Holliday junction resolvase
VTTPYARGADFERRVIRRLIEQGHHPVVRAAGSKGPIDIVSYLGTVAYFVQVKGGNETMTRKERLELVELAHDCGAIPVLVTRGMHFEVLAREGSVAA